MPPAITHDSGFEIALSHQDELLTIYDSVGVSNNSQGGSSRTIAHVGKFSGISNKAIVRRKTSAELIQLQLLILQDFNFFSGDAVQFGLHVVTANGNQKKEFLDPILKKTHDAERKNPTGISWFPLETSEAPNGTVSISVTRCDRDHQTGACIPLSGEQGVPYVVDVEWRQVEEPSSIDDDMKRRVTRGMQNGSPAVQAAPRGRPTKVVECKATKKTEHFDGPSKGDASIETTKVETPMEQISPEEHDSDIERNVEPTTNDQQKALGTADLVQESSLASRLGDEDRGAILAQLQEAPDDDEAETFTTPPEILFGYGENAGPESDTKNFSQGSVVSSTPTQALEPESNETPSRKRNADEAFGLDREKEMIRLSFEVELAKAGFDVDDAKAQEMTDTSQPEYFALLLKKAQSNHDVAEAEFALKAAQLDGKKDIEYGELKIRKAEAYLAVLEAEENTHIGAEGTSPNFKLRKAYAELEVVEAKAEQTTYKGLENNVEDLQMLLKIAQAHSGVASAEFEVKAAECGENKDAAYFRLQTRKAEAHRKAIQAKGRLLLKTTLRQ